MKHRYLNDMIEYYKPLVPLDKIDAIIESVEKQHPTLYKRNSLEYLTMIEIEINNYIGNKELGLYG